MFQKLKEIFAKQELKELEKLKLEIETYKTKQLSLDNLTKEVNSYKESISKNQEIFDSKENTYKEEIKNLRKELDVLTQQKLNESNSNKKLIDDLNEELKKLNDNKENSNKNLQELESNKFKFEELNNLIENKDNKIKELENNIQSLVENINNLKNNEKKYLQEINELNENIKDLRQEVKNINIKPLIQNLTLQRKEIKNILIVDDSKIITVQAEKALTQRGFNVKTSISGKNAIEILNKEQIDLVITDVNMPDMNGIELTLWIKQNKPECPVILMTAFETEEIKKYALEFNSKMFLEKPINFDNVVSKVNDINNNLYTKELNLNDIILMFIISRMNQVINVSKDDNNLLGKIYFSLGEIVHAEYSNLTGLEALEQIMNFKLYKFSSNEITDIPNKTITEKSIQILLRNSK